MNKLNAGFKKILWAVDVSAPKGNLQLAACKVIRALTRSGNVPIEPAHVLRTDSPVPVANAVKKWLSKIKLPGLTEPTLLTQKGVYLRSDIDALLTHAKHVNADLIVVTTHAKTGVPRFWMGSFAETLLLHSNVPVLFVNPHTQAPATFKEILFPTNLSATSRKSFENTLSLASALKSKIVIYHRLQSYGEITGLPLLRPDSGYKRKLKTAIQDRTVLLEKWANEAQSRGVKVKIIVDNIKHSLPDAVLAHAKSMPSGMVAMAAETGPLATVLVGSTTRKIVRSASIPVWVTRD